jgi:hypothetical protein
VTSKAKMRYHDISISSVTKQLLLQGSAEKVVDNTPFDAGNLSESPVLDIWWVLNVHVAEEGWHAGRVTALGEGYYIHRSCSLTDQGNVILPFVSISET